jgi:hypothetical protein
MSQTLVLAGLAAIGSSPPTPAAAQTAGALRLEAPTALATGLAVPLAGHGATAGDVISIERAMPGAWRSVRTVHAGGGGSFQARYRPPIADRVLRVRARVVAGPDTGAVSPSRLVHIRDVVLASVGDINLGDGPAQEMSVHGLRWPWLSVAPLLRSADIAFGNLECAIATRGRPVAKQYRFRGSPAALAAARSFAGLDVVNLANNHTGDFGADAFLDTRRHVARLGIAGVGAGANLALAARPSVVQRLGLRIAFVGFSEILPAEFFAGPDKPGTVFASPGAVAAGVSAARRRADVVVATFHWGVERAGRENARQRELASVALRAGATVVIGAHPHVLHPVVRRGHRLIAYSLGNFVFSMGGGATSRTGVLLVRLSTRGVESSTLRRAVISSAQPRLR